MDTEAMSTANLALALHNVLSYIEEPCNRIDFDDFDRGESAMASAILWIIHDTVGGGILNEKGN
jgi:hypothetical protein